MRYVLDASVAVTAVLARPLTVEAQNLLQERRKGLHELVAPSVFHAEVAGALTKAERQKLIAVGESLILLDQVLSDLPRIYAYEPLLRRATEISSETRSGLYDCLYVALAEREGIEVVTADVKLVNNLQRKYPFVILLSDLT